MRVPHPAVTVFRATPLAGLSSSLLAEIPGGSRRISETDLACQAFFARRLQNQLMSYSMAPITVTLVAITKILIQ